MTSTKVPVPCDCLNDCGDDPWLKEGKSKPCQKRIEQQERAREFAARSARVSSIIAQHGAQDIYDLVEQLHAKVSIQQAGATS